MLFLQEFQSRPNKLADLIPWAALVAPDVVLNKDGSFQSTVTFRGPDLDSSTESELVIVAARLNNIFRRFGEGYVIACEAKRATVSDYPNSNFPDPVSYLLDEERRSAFLESEHFESRYYLTILYLPPSDSAKRIESLFFVEEKKAETINYQEILEAYRTEVRRVVDLLHGVLPEIHLLEGEELLSYLHSTVSTKDHAVQVPPEPMYLDGLLCDETLVTGLSPSLGKKHFRVISLCGFPGMSTPGILDALNRLSISYRWVTRFVLLGKAQAERELKSYKRRWFSKRKGVLTLLKETMTGTDSIMVDSDAVTKANDADQALQVVQSDHAAFGYFSASIVLFDSDQERLSANAGEVERVINGLGFVTRSEDINAVDEWLATIPGNARNGIRRPLLHTLNLSHLMPLSAVWAGPKSDEHLEAPVILNAFTGGSTAFRFTTRVGDVGHALVLGPTGAGKSVLLNIIEAQFLRYPDAQIYVFDKGGSSRILTAGVGGDFFDLGADQSDLSFQPLAEIDVPQERRWASEWLLEILAQENVTITPSVKEHLWVALTSLSSAPVEQRTIYGLTVLLQDHELRQALLPYTCKGAHGKMLDGSRETLRYGFFQAFEMEVLMESPSVVMPTLRYLFHKLEKRFTGVPSLLVLDEAWLFLDNPLFAQKIREWLKVLRKANVSVIFATQSLADVEGSPIAPTLKEACLTKIYLPNASALTEQARSFYEKFGLNERQVHILAEALPKRHYYYTSPLGNRLFELRLGDVAKAYCGATSKEVQRDVLELYRRCQTLPEFNKRYLEAKGITWATEALEVLSGEGEEEAA